MTWLQYLEHRVKKWDRCFPTSTSKSDSVAAVLLTTSTLISIQANTALRITGSGDRTSFYSPKNKPASVCVLATSNSSSIKEPRGLPISSNIAVLVLLRSSSLE